MKTTLFAASLALVMASPSAFAQHSHGPDHSHDHGHSHDQDGAHDHDAPADGHHDHGDRHDGHAITPPVMGGLTISPLTAVEAGAPVTVALSLQNAEGAEVTANDLAVTHERKLHVMIIDEGLEDYIHTHPDPDENGRFAITFTPKCARAYRIWADFTVADEDAPAPAAAERDHHDAPSGTPVVAAASLAVGDDAAPAFAGKNALFVDAGALRFRLWADGDVKAGETARFRLSVTDEDGTPFRGLEPIMGAYAHLVGFDPGATAMAHAHPSGAHPHGPDSRGGPDLVFDVMLDKPGPHRLFLQTRKDGEEIAAAFTVVAQP